VGLSLCQNIFEKDRWYLRPRIRSGSFYNFLIAWEYKRAVPVRPSLRAASDGLERD
jgi:hypothetical protein